MPPLEMMMQPVRNRDDWETLLRSYLRRVYSVKRMAELNPPERILERQQQLVRTVWLELLEALKQDFGAPRLVDPQVHDYVNLQLKRAADEIALEQLHPRAIAWGRPCEHCVHCKDPDESWDADDSFEEMTSEELIQLNCAHADPKLVESKLTEGRFTYTVSRCEDFKPLPLLGKDEEMIRKAILDSLETATAEFDVWRDELDIGEQLLT